MGKLYTESFSPWLVISVFFNISFHRKHKTTTQYNHSTCSQRPMKSANKAQLPSTIATRHLKISIAIRDHHAIAKVLCLRTSPRHSSWKRIWIDNFPLKTPPISTSFPISINPNTFVTFGSINVIRSAKNGTLRAPSTVGKQDHVL